MDALADAIAAMPRPDDRKRLVTGSGGTDDIVAELLAVSARSRTQTARLAPRLAGRTRRGTALNVWRFLRQNIRYVLDKSGYQFIKTPARTVADRYSDCKGYAILASSVLHNLGVPHLTRFAAYDGERNVTHVYTVAIAEDGREIPIDACLPYFGEKPYSHKQDHDMTRIYSVSGIGGAAAPLATTPYELDPYASDAMTELLLARERMELEKQILADPAVAGIGQAGQLAESYDYNLALLNRAVDLAAQGRTDELADLGERLNAATVNGAHVGKTKVGRFLQRVGQGAKKVAQTAAKVVTAPARLAVKGILEAALPKAGPAFLYVFLTDGQAAKSPAKVQRKRTRQLKFVRFVTNVIGMKEDRVRTILRNGIMKEMKDTPERLLARRMGAAVSGPAVGIVIPPQVIQVVVQIIQKIAQAFGKKPAPDEEMGADDVPSEQDWAGFMDSAGVPATPALREVTAPRLNVTALQPVRRTTGSPTARTTTVTVPLPGQNTALAPQGLAPAQTADSADNAGTGLLQGKAMLPLLLAGGALVFMMSRKKS